MFSSGRDRLYASAPGHVGDAHGPLRHQVSSTEEVAQPVVATAAVDQGVDVVELVALPLADRQRPAARGRSPLARDQAAQQRLPLVRGEREERAVVRRSRVRVPYRAPGGEARPFLRRSGRAARPRLAAGGDG